MKKKIQRHLQVQYQCHKRRYWTTVHAETTDEKIAAQDSKISNLTAQQKEFQKQVDEIQTQLQLSKLNKRTEAENETLQAESKNLKEKLQSSQEHCCSYGIFGKQARNAQQTVLQLAISIQL